MDVCPGGELAFSPRRGTFPILVSMILQPLDPTPLPVPQVEPRSPSSHSNQCQTHPINLLLCYGWNMPACPFLPGREGPILEGCQAECDPLVPGQQRSPSTDSLFPELSMHPPRPIVSPPAQPTPSPPRPGTPTTPEQSQLPASPLAQAAGIGQHILTQQEEMNPGCSQCSHPRTCERQKCHQLARPEIQNSPGAAWTCHRPPHGQLLQQS